MIKRVAYGLIGLSYSYGFCRGWTLPIWSDIHKASFRESVTRITMSVGSGMMYILPPFCFIKYLNMYGRLYERKHGMNNYRGEIWREWGICHPRTF